MVVVVVVTLDLDIVLLIGVIVMVVEAVLGFPIRVFVSAVHLAVIIGPGSMITAGSV